MNRRLCLIVGFVSIFCDRGHGQSDAYVLRTFAGQFPIGNGGPALSALLLTPYDATYDAAGNLYIADSFAIRKVSPEGTITAFAQGTFLCLATGRDGNLYAGASGAVYRFTPAGVRTTFAGTGTFGTTAGDGGPATSAVMGTVGGIAFDPQGRLLLTEAHRVRRVGTDGIIQTIAGTEIGGFAGDGGPATQARLNFPMGVGVDSAGSIYVADRSNRRIRKISPGGIISTFAGAGAANRPTDGDALLSSFGSPSALVIDARDNLFVTDATYGVVLRIAPGGQLTRVAGNFTSVKGVDGQALVASLFSPRGISIDAAANVIITEQAAHRIRKLTLAGLLQTIAGRTHFEGDGGPATAALFDQPIDIEIDPRDGRVIVADTFNSRLRIVTNEGQISTVLGNGTYGISVDGPASASTSILYIASLAIDPNGGLLFGESNRIRRFAGGNLSTVAGTGSFGDLGDGGPATAATLNDAGFVAADKAGNVYVTDRSSNRIRRISPEGVISAFVGTGSTGFSGDGGLATAASINLGFSYGAMAVDPAGNLYFCDGFNYRIRRVTPGGIITTVVGNGNFGFPADGGQAAGGPFFSCTGIAFDQAGDMFVTVFNTPSVFRVSGGLIRRVSGGGSNPLVEGVVATTTTGFTGRGLRVDAEGDLLVADPAGNVIRKLVKNSPASLRVADGDGQRGRPGETLTKPLRVQLVGRAEVGIAAASVAFTVISGSATLSASTTRTDASGNAGIAVTLGSTLGPVVVSASFSNPPLTARFNLEVVPAGSGTCPLSAPTITSVRSLSDFGGLTTFASGSWLEIKGTNLATGTRIWRGDEFNGASAPTALDGTGVSIGGRSAFVYFISPTQVNVQAPDDESTGSVAVTVSNCAATSPAVNVQKAAIAPGLLAPASFNVGGKQYLVALHADNVTYVGNVGLIAGVPFAPAKPGDSIVAYGVGFGPVSPSVPAGTVVSQATSIPNLTVKVGQVNAAITFAGLAPGNIGLYQFNLRVPDIANGDQPVTVVVGDYTLPQVLNLTIRR